MPRRTRRSRSFGSAFLKGALALLLSIACVPAEALATGKQAWGATGGYAVFYQQDEKEDCYTLVLQSSPTEDSSYGRLVRCEELDEFSWSFSSSYPELAQNVTKVVMGDSLQAPQCLFDCFSGMSKCTLIDLSELDTSGVESMDWMFADCSSLWSLDLSSFDTSKVKDMCLMFDGCSSLKSLDLSSFDTSRVESMNNMFSRCSSLESLDLSGFDTSAVTDMGDMFYDCPALRSLDLSGFDTSKVESMIGMFEYDATLKTIFATDKFVIPSDMRDNGMFTGCTSLRGGNGTKYDASHTDSLYARIDAPGQPGYFTQGVHSPAPQPPTSPSSPGENTPQIPTNPTPNPGESTTQSPTTPSNSGGSTAATPATPGKTTLTSLAKAQATVSSKTYTGKTLKPSKISVKVGGKTLAQGRDFTVSCKGGKKVGSYKVTIKGKGNYTGTKTATFKILPKGTSVSKAKAAKRGFTVTWKKPSKTNLKQTTGYKVQWSTDKKFKKGVKSKLVKKNKTTSLKVGKLKGGKKYYVRICTYKKVGGKYYYSSWSKAKVVKTKK